MFLKRRKLDVHKAQEIRDLYSSGQNYSQQELGEKYGVSAMTIGKIVDNKSYLDNIEKLPIKQEKENNSMDSNIIEVNSLINLTEEDLKDLPPDLIKELTKTTRTSKRQSLVVSLMEKNQGYISVNQLRVRIFKTTNKILRKTTIYPILVILQKKGVIKKHPLIQSCYFLTNFKKEEGAPQDK